MECQRQFPNAESTQKVSCVSHKAAATTSAPPHTADASAGRDTAADGGEQENHTGAATTEATAQDIGAFLHPTAAQLLMLAAGEGVGARDCSVGRRKGLAENEEGWEVLELVLEAERAQKRAEGRDRELIEAILASPLQIGVWCTWFIYCLCRCHTTHACTLECTLACTHPRKSTLAHAQVCLTRYWSILVHTSTPQARVLSSQYRCSFPFLHPLCHRLGKDSYLIDIKQCCLPNIRWSLDRGGATAKAMGVEERRCSRI